MEITLSYRISRHETKIMLNSTKAKPKISRVERLLSKMVFLIFMIQVKYSLWILNKPFLGCFLCFHSTLF